MPRTITGSYSLTQSINVSDNPLYVDGTIVVQPGTALPPNGVQGASNFAATLFNAGTIEAAGFGVSLGQGSTVDNQAGGLIASSVDTAGVVLVSGSVTNAGSIAGITVQTGAGTVANQGVIARTGASSIGVNLQAGGSIDNAATGTISGALAGVGANGITTLTNHGSITNSATASGTGMYIQGGSVSNDGTISGYEAGIEITGTLGVTIDNAPGKLISGHVSAIYSSLALPSLGSVTIDNQGTLIGTTGAALDLGLASASVTNASGALIAGYGTYGVGVVFSDHNVSGTFVNHGTVRATGKLPEAVGIFKGYALNAADGTLFGSFAAVKQGTLVNQGSIHGYGALDDGGTFTNAAGASIGGSPAGDEQGVEVFAAPGTVVNAGTISSTTGHAIYFQPGYADRLVVDPTAVFVGAIDGGNTIGSSIVSTIELAAGGAAGTLAGFGTTITNFSAIAFDPGATWDISGVLAGFSGGITGFAPGDTLDITNVVATRGTFAAGELTLFNGGSVAATIPVAGSFASGAFTVDPSTGAITVACFAAGTRITTPGGEILIESLAAGDMVQTVGAGPQPIAWIGHRHVDCRRHRNPASVWPVRVRAGAFGVGRPRRDLLLSPDHAVFVNAVLIPIRHLIDDTSIAQIPVDDIAYFHLELPRHAVLLADGLPAESYLDTGNRANFSNGEVVELFPDFAAWVRDAAICAPLVITGPLLEAARRLVRENATTIAPSSSRRRRHAR